MSDKKPKKTRVYMMTPAATLEFFKLVQKFTEAGYKDSEVLRSLILNEMAKSGKMKTVYDTNRTQDEVIAGYKKNGLKVDDRRMKHDMSSRITKDNEKSFMGRVKRGVAWLVKVFTLGLTKGPN